MSNDPSRLRSKLSGIDREEELAWLGFYRSVRNDVCLAAEVIAQLEADPEMKRRHLALYLCCKQSLRIHKAHQQRDRRIGRFVRWLSHGVFITPVRALKLGARLALECLPEVAREPAIRKVGKLTAEKEFAAAQVAFDQQGAAPVTAAAAPVPGPGDAPRAGAAVNLVNKQA
jgi:hypothetical protein